VLYGIVVHLMLFNQYCTLRSSFVNALKQKCKASMQTTMLKKDATAIFTVSLQETYWN